MPVIIGNVMYTSRLKSQFQKMFRLSCFRRSTLLIERTVDPAAVKCSKSIIRIEKNIGKRRCVFVAPLFS